MSKVRAGLYRYTYDITERVQVQYLVEYNPEGLNGFKNKWAIAESVGREDEIWFENPFSTKQEALDAIKYVQENGEYRYLNDLGWCYYDK